MGNNMGKLKIKISPGNELVCKTYSDTLPESAVKSSSEDSNQNDQIGNLMACSASQHQNVGERDGGNKPGQNSADQRFDQIEMSVQQLLDMYQASQTETQNRLGKLEHSQETFENDIAKLDSSMADTKNDMEELKKNNTRLNEVMKIFLQQAGYDRAEAKADRDLFQRTIHDAQVDTRKSMERLEKALLSLANLGQENHISDVRHMTPDSAFESTFSLSREQSLLSESNL